MKEGQETSLDGNIVTFTYENKYQMIITRKMIKKSNGHTMDDIRRLWFFNFIEDHGKPSVKCACGKEIRYRYVFYNEETNKVLSVGSECIQSNMPGKHILSHTTIERLENGINPYSNYSDLWWLFSYDFINEWEYNFLSEVGRRTKGKIKKRVETICNSILIKLYREGVVK